MGLKTMGFSVVAIAAGAVMYWAVTTGMSGFRISTVGVILMAMGAVGFIASAVVYGSSRQAGGSRHQTYERSVAGEKGQSSAVHEEVHQ